MKRNIIFLLFCSLMGTALAQPEHYYYYEDKKIGLDTVDNTVCILLTNESEHEQFLNEVSQYGEIDTLDGGNGHVVIKVKTETEQQYATLIEFVSNSPDVRKRSSLFHDRFSNLFSTSMGEVIVKLKEEYGIGDLEALAAEYNFEILRSLESDNNVYAVRCNSNNGNDAIFVANRLFLNDISEYAEPNFNMYDVLCTSDEWYNLYQWALHQASPGMGTSPHIDVEPVWNSGNLGNSAITIGLVDNGVYSLHPDLVGCLIQGYNVLDGSTNTEPDPYPNLEITNHGTVCAGIIGAQHNTIGIAGIAPNCKIMPVKITGSNTATTYIDLADGVTYAATHGADVICCSYVCMYSSYVTSAINSALTTGRGNLGCVIVAPSGNKSCGTTGNDHVKFPANMEGVISVGAMATCSHMANGNYTGSCYLFNHCFSYDNSNDHTHCGCYGDSLDIVAPGVNVLSTAIPNSYHVFSQDSDYAFYNGTSVSCAHVAGVAAMILSSRGDLHNYQVNAMLRSSASKFGSGSYTYAYSSQHPYGTWNIETGYGEVDAYNAVSMANSLPMHEILIKDYSGDQGFEPTALPQSSYNSPYIWLKTVSGNNLVTQPETGTTYKVYMKLTNIGNSLMSLASSHIKMYWYVGTSEPVWNNTWQQGGSLCGYSRTGQVDFSNYNIQLQAGNSMTLVSQISIPDYSSGNCILPTPLKLTLLAVIDDGNTSVGLNSSNYPLYDFVRYNNNVAKKTYVLNEINIGPMPLGNSVGQGENGAALSYNTVYDSTGNFMTITPNPTEKDACVSITLDADYSDVQIEILDASGKSISRNKVTSPTFNISTSNMPDGTFFIVLTGDGKVLESKQFIIIQH